MVGYRLLLSGAAGSDCAAAALRLASTRTVYLQAMVVPPAAALAGGGSISCWWRLLLADGAGVHACTYVHYCWPQAGTCAEGEPGLHVPSACGVQGCFEGLAR